MECVAPPADQRAEFMIDPITAVENFNDLTAEQIIEAYVRANAHRPDYPNLFKVFNELTTALVQRQLMRDSLVTEDLVIKMKKVRNAFYERIGKQAFTYFSEKPCVKTQGHEYKISDQDAMSLSDEEVPELIEIIETPFTEMMNRVAYDEAYQNALKDDFDDGFQKCSIPSLPSGNEMTRRINNETIEWQIRKVAHRPNVKTQGVTKRRNSLTTPIDPALIVQTATERSVVNQQLAHYQTIRSWFEHIAERPNAEIQGRTITLGNRDTTIDAAEQRRRDNVAAVTQLFAPKRNRSKVREYINYAAWISFLFVIGLFIGWTAMFFLQYKDLTQLPKDELFARNPVAYTVYYRPFARAQMLNSYRGTGLDLVGDNDNPVAKEQTTKSKSGVVSGVFRALSGVAGAFSFVPVYGGIASAASAVFKAGQWIASYFGYDYPVNVSSVDGYMVRQTSGLANVCGLDSAEPIGCDPQNSVSNDPKYFCEIGGPYQNFAHYRLLPALVQVNSFNASLGLNGVIVEYPVAPTFMSNNTHATTWTLTPIGNLASMFRYWRGGMKYKIQFTCSKFISCRVRVEWYPDPTVSTYFFNDTSGDVISLIVDINGDTDVPFMVPYLQDRPYIATAPPDTWTKTVGFWTHLCNGKIVVRLLIPPTASNTTYDTTVYYAIWQSGAEDFECYRPTDLFKGYEYSSNAVVFGKNNNNSINERRFARTQGRATTRAEFATTFPPLIPCGITAISKILHGETVQSFIDLFHRYTFVKYAQFGGGGALNVCSFDVPNLDQFFSQWNIFQNSFLMHRGNVRYKFMQMDNSTNTVIAVSNAITNVEGPLEQMSQLPERNGMTWNLSAFRYSNEVDVPFYGIFPLICRQSSWEKYEWPSAQINTQELGNFDSHNYNVYTACGDTYSCGIPIPPGYIGFAPALVANKPLAKTQMKTSENAQSGFPHEERKVAEPTVQESNQLTSFRDTVGVKEAPGGPITSIHQKADPYPDQGLAPLLSRPYLTQYFNWTGSSAIGALIATLSYPHDLFTIPNIASKLDRFKYFRAGVHVEIRLNSTTFHSGKLLIVWCPHWNPGNTQNQLIDDDMYALSALDNITMSACANETVAFDIPYVAPSAYFDLTRPSTSGSPGYGFFGTVKLFVLAPLVLTGNATTPSLTVTVFSNFINPEPAGPIPFAELLTEDKGCSVPQTKISKSLKDKLAQEK